ncbi:hypothetical protein J6590_079082 [Homalodisca vitripennis]|nr:hypothetical protein J6590_079082 [Homalodisca vitripennis]
MSMNDPQSSQENVTSLLETLFPESELKLCDENIDSDTPCEDNSNTNCLKAETCKSPGGFRGGMLPGAKRCQIQRHSRGRELPKSAIPLCLGKSCDEFQRQSPTPMEDIDSLDGIFPRELLAPAVKLAIDELLPLEPTQELSMPMETSEGIQANIAGEPETVPIVTADDVKRIPEKKKKVCRQPVRRSLRLSLKRINEQDKRDRLVSDASEVASEFNRFFASVAGGLDPRSYKETPCVDRAQHPHWRWLLKGKSTVTAIVNLVDMVMEGIEGDVNMSSSANCPTCANLLLPCSEKIQTACEEKEANIAGEPETVPIVTAKNVKSIPRKKKNICRKPLRRSLRLFLQISNEFDKEQGE